MSDNFTPINRKSMLKSNLLKIMDLYNIYTMQYE